MIAFEQDEKASPIINNFTETFVRENNYQINNYQIRKLRKKWKQYVAELPPYPDVYSGRGIVTCAGGYIYLTCFWVNISMLRKLGCTLPVELWYEGAEVNLSMKNAFEQLDVVCKNCSDYSAIPVKGYSMKPFAILHSSFKEILFLDADNNCVVNPAYLFDYKEYIDCGAMFWPDFWTTSIDNPIWKIVSSKAFLQNEQESGQILINKEKCWKELNLCMFFNRNSDPYHKMLLGDKDTFKFAWIALNTKFYMIPTSVGYCGYSDFRGLFYGMTMVQHDFKGDIIFLHRNSVKWAIVNEDEVLWTTIKKFRSREAKYKPRSFQMGNFKMTLADADGDVEVFSFTGLFGDYELDCLNILKDLRNSTAYASFLQHLCVLPYRLGYTGNLIELVAQSFRRD